MKRVSMFFFGMLSLSSLSASAVFAQEPGDYFKIRVVDQETGRGVPLVEFKMTNSIRYYTDNNGIIAFYEPGLMGRKVYFTITSPGYTFPDDFFGNPGTTFRVTAGDSALVRLERTNVAERLYRYTGEGRYHQSIRLGLPVPAGQAALQAQVTGLDATMAVPYRGKIFWTWGDTEKLSASIGHFAVSGATSEFPDRGGMDPDRGIDITYFVDEEGFAKQMCPVPGPGMVWNHWMGVLPDETGTERLVLHYRRHKDLEHIYESGLAIYNDEKEVFEPFFRYDTAAPLLPKGHYLLASFKGERYQYFSFTTPYMLRARADLEHFKDIHSYEAYTCLKEGTRYRGNLSEMDRNEEGDLVYSWKRDTDPVDYDRQQELIDYGKMKQEEGWLQACDLENGMRIKLHAGSVYWNAYRQKWIMIVQGSDDQAPGDIWYGEGDTPVGPWVYFRKVATHNQYNLYNPTQLPFFDKERGRYIYFDGTYSNTFTTTDYGTPRYDYNLLLYRLDLDDPRLCLPAPVYKVTDKDGQPEYLLRESVDSMQLWSGVDRIPFYAIPPDRPVTGLRAVFLDRENRIRRLEASSGQQPAFYGLPLFDSMEEVLCGTWQCSAEGFPLQLDIRKMDDTLNISFRDESLLVTKVECSGDSMVMHITDMEDQKDYTITAFLSGGRMTGQIVENATMEAGVWQGMRCDMIWELFQSESVVPLYEYEDASGKNIYSTEKSMPGLKRSVKPVCHVWKNPSTTLPLDYQANPVPAPSFSEASHEIRH